MLAQFHFFDSYVHWDQMGCSGNEFLEGKMLQKLATQLQVFSQSSNANVKLETRLETLEPVVSNLCFVNCREKRAAVLICLFEGDEGEFRVILTKRSMKLSSHPGEVSLPGGKMEEADEDDSATALREAMEEIGLDSGLVQVVANLEPFMSQHQLTVVPVLGLLQKIEDFKPLLNTDEVDAIFDVPLEMFLKEENHRCEERVWKGKKYVLHLFNFESEHENFLIWGLTASILIRAASVIYQRPPCFNQNLPDFQQVQKSLKPEPPP